MHRVEPKPSLIVLYGSEARGEATPESDIDLLLLLDRYAVISAFGRRLANADRVPRRLHKTLFVAFEDRGGADYELAWEPTQETAERRLSEAEEFVTGREAERNRCYNWSWRRCALAPRERCR